MDCSTPGFPVHHQLPELAQTHVHRVTDTIQPSSLSPPAFFPSIRAFSNESVLHIRWPKYWNFSISPSNEYSGLNSFRMDWLDLLAVQGTPKRLLQHHSSNASILQRSAFFTVQLSHPSRPRRCPGVCSLGATVTASSHSSRVYWGAAVGGRASQLRGGPDSQGHRLCQLPVVSGRQHQGSNPSPLSPKLLAWTPCCLTSGLLGAAGGLLGE